MTKKRKTAIDYQPTAIKLKEKKKLFIASKPTDFNPKKLHITPFLFLHPVYKSYFFVKEHVDNIEREKKKSKTCEIPISVRSFFFPLI